MSAHRCRQTLVWIRWGARPFHPASLPNEIALGDRPFEQLPGVGRKRGEGHDIEVGVVLALLQVRAARTQFVDTASVGSSSQLRGVVAVGQARDGAPNMGGRPGVASAPCSRQCRSSVSRRGCARGRTSRRQSAGTLAVGRALGQASAVGTCTTRAARGLMRAPPIRSMRHASCPRGTGCRCASQSPC